MKSIVTLALILSSVVCSADCYYGLSQGKDSTAHQVNVSYVVDLASIYNSSKYALKRLFNEYNCKDVQVKNFKCSEVIKGQPESQVCYVRADVGYFIINKDYLGNVNMIFNRFD